LRVREPFEERITGALSSRRERGFSCCPWMGRESGRRCDRHSRPPATVITAGPLSAALTVAPGWRCWVVRWAASSRGIGFATGEARWWRAVRRSSVAPQAFPHGVGLFVPAEGEPEFRL
jgi:hypothetical protein